MYLLPSSRYMATESLNRLELLKQLCRDRGWVQADGHKPSPGLLGKAIDRKTNYCSDLLNGRAKFGEDIARHIEASAGLPRFYLDGGVPDFSDQAISVALMLDRVPDDALKTRIYAVWSTTYDAMVAGSQIAPSEAPPNAPAAATPRVGKPPTLPPAPAKKRRTG